MANPDAELTVLAPTDDAFAAIPAEDFQMLQEQPAALAYVRHHTQTVSLHAYDLL